MPAVPERPSTQSRNHKLHSPWHAPTIQKRITSYRPWNSKIKKIQKKTKTWIFKKSKNIQKTIENTGGTPVFSEKIDCFLNIFWFFENFENIENFNFFSSFKVFLKTTPVAAIGNFNICESKQVSESETAVSESIFLSYYVSGTLSF